MVRETLDAEVVIAGAGLAGVAAAFVLARSGIEVALIDQRELQPPVFKAEKLEPDQIEILREFGMLDALLPVCTPIHRIAVGVRGRVLGVSEIEQYSYFYQDLVNAARQALPANVKKIVGRIASVRASASGSEAQMSDGRLVSGRLLVVATGTAGKLHDNLGLARRMLAEGHSVCVGFSCHHPGRLPRDSDSLTYFGEHVRSGVDYISLFPIQDILRANLFAYWTARDDRLTALRQGGIEALNTLMPRLTKASGPLSLASKIEARPIDLYRVQDAARAGAVLVGDAFQSVCPATGTGLSKVLNDVRALHEHALEWLRHKEIGADLVSCFYRDERKCASDERSLASARYRRRFGTDTSLRFRIHRAMEYFRWWNSGLG